MSGMIVLEVVILGVCVALLVASLAVARRARRNLDACEVILAEARDLADRSPGG